MKSEGHPRKSWLALAFFKEIIKSPRQSLGLYTNFKSPVIRENVRSLKWHTA